MPDAPTTEGKFLVSRLINLRLLYNFPDITLFAGPGSTRVLIFVLFMEVWDTVPFIEPMESSI